MMFWYLCLIWGDIPQGEEEILKPTSNGAWNLINCWPSGWSATNWHLSSVPGPASQEGERRFFEKSLLSSCIGAVLSLKKDILRGAKSIAQPCANACALHLTQGANLTQERVVSKQVWRLQAFLTSRSEREKAGLCAAYYPGETQPQRFTYWGLWFWLVLHSDKPLELTLELPAHLVYLASSPVFSVTLPSWRLLWLG